MLSFKEYFNLIILNEFSEGAIKKIIAKFQNDASEQEIRRELGDFEKYKNSIDKKDPFQYKSWIEFTEAIHGAKGRAQFKNKKPVEQNITANQDDIIADDENVTIYKGDTQDKCVMYGQGYTFCIARRGGGNMFNSYRLGKESTFYFIYFKKKPKSAEDHIMVLDHTRDGYEWTFADNNTQRVEGGWDEVVGRYPELNKYKNLLTSKKLTEEEKHLLEMLKDFAKEPSLEKFNKFSYKVKAQALKSIVNLPDEIWQVLDLTLRNEFLSTGPNLTDYQADDLKSNEIERYKKTRDISFKALAEPLGDGDSKDIIRINKYDTYENIISKAISSYSYATDVLKLKNVPEEVLRGIAQDGEFAYSYAQDLKWKNVPDVIMKGIISLPYMAFHYADRVLHWINVPDEVMDSIASDHHTAFRYASEVLDWKNIPDKIKKGMRPVLSEPWLKPKDREMVELYTSNK